MWVYVYVCVCMCVCVCVCVCVCDIHQGETKCVKRKERKEKS